MFCDLQRFRRKTAVLRPKITRTDLQSPRKTAPVRRLTVSRKPLSTASRLHFHQNSQSLAQPYLLRNGLYPTPLRGILLRSIDFRPPMVRKRQVNARPHGCAVLSHTALRLHSRKNRLPARACSARSVSRGTQYRLGRAAAPVRTHFWRSRV